jgi:hypothetical protein
VTVTPVPFSSSVNARDSERTYAFVAAWAPVIGAGVNEPIEPRFRIRPHRRSKQSPAKSLANSTPDPLDAPVISAVRRSLLWPPGEDIRYRTVDASAINARNSPKNRTPIAADAGDRRPHGRRGRRVGWLHAAATASTASSGIGSTA